MSCLRDLIGLHLVLLPQSRYRRDSTGAVQHVFCMGTGSISHHIRSIAVGAEPNQVSGEALRAFHAVANTGHRKSPFRFDSLISSPRERKWLALSAPTPTSGFTANSTCGSAYLLGPAIFDRAPDR